LPIYLGPKAYIAVADFDVKTAKANNEIGSGLQEMLIVALSGNSRFSVVERQEANTVVNDISTSEGTQAGNESAPDNKPADLIITVAVTEFEPQASGGSDGLGGGGGVGNGDFGGLLGGALNKAKMALDIRLVDAATSEVIASTLIQGQAADSGAAISGELGKWSLAAVLSPYANTSMEKAIRVCILESVRYLSQTIPAKYYKYK
jgi:curli biogenesis system outer membrane secretion channel CsgG